MTLTSFEWSAPVCLWLANPFLELDPPVRARANTVWAILGPIQALLCKQCIVTHCITPLWHMLGLEGDVDAMRAS